MPGMNLGIDLGTSQVTIYVSGQGIVLREPSVIAVDSRTGKMIACGGKAYEMLGKTPDSIRAIRPLTKGVISEYDYAEKMLKTFVRRVCKYKVMKPKAAVSIPSTVTEVEQRSVVEALLNAGTRNVVIIEEPVAAAIGAGLDISKPYGSMIVDIGAGTTDAAVLSLRGIANSLSIRVGGNDMDEAIIRYMHNRYYLVIGPIMAEKIKNTIGRAITLEGNPVMKVKGRDVVSGLPRIQEVCAEEIQEAMSDPVMEIMKAIQHVLESTAPELVGDVFAGGICLTGGCAQMHGMREAVSAYTGVECLLADNPTDCVAIGTGKALSYVGVLSSGVYDVSQFNYPLSDSSHL